MVSPVAAHLREPPIVEVICGFFFAPIAEIDPIVVGKYWSEHKEKSGNPPFPKKQLMPLVTDRPSFLIDDGVGPLRCWLISESDEYLIQIQPDRFYFNWRKRNADYPHFNRHDAKDGVLERGLREFGEFAKFCGAVIGQIPKPTRLELAKLDLFEQGKNFSDFNDLASFLPIVKEAMDITKSPDPALQFRIACIREGHNIQFHLNSAALATDMRPAVQVEMRATGEVGDESLHDRFIRMNEIINDVFFGLIGQDTKYGRFGGTLP